MSTELVDAVLDEAASRGETLTIHDLLRLIERFDTGPGVPDDRLDSYIRALDAGRFDEAALREGLDTRLVDAAEWQTETAVYRLDGGVSAFPARWHEDLTSETDLTRYVATMTTAVGGLGGVRPRRSRRRRPRKTTVGHGGHLWRLYV
ncbi:hypothetical protein [Halohasta salina]|uniref:hypothetical protein n=1 Tax=Halohasta salina TaxID=2961621 RepID=UPI0020A4E938|nr:hypothetical protein [Halohasta salina]